MIDADGSRRAGGDALASRPSADAAKDRKAARKTREFKQYLNESGTVEGMVKLLVGMMEAPTTDRIDADNVLQDFFGHYRDPVWDVVEGFWASNDSERAKKSELEAKVTEIEADIAAAKRRLESVEVWRALAPDPSGESKSLKNIKGKDFLMRMTGLKKPQEGLTPPDELVREKFIDVVDGYADGPMRDWALALAESLRATKESAEPICVGDRMQEPELLSFFQDVQNCL